MARWSGHKILEYEVVCANANCPRLGIPFVVTGKQRLNAKQRGGRAYCSPGCSAAGKGAHMSAFFTGRPFSAEHLARLSAATTAQWADPAARERQAVKV